MERPFEAYRGDEPYVFICYSHDDQAVVYPEITWLHEQGINVWYDEGISPGEEWSEELGRAIEGAERFLYFVSPQSVASRHCRNELNFAQNHDKAILSVYLEETELPSGVELVIGASQAIVKPELTERDYRTRLLRVVGPVKDSPPPVRDDKATGPDAGPQPTHGTPRPSLVSWLVAAAVLVVAGAGAAFWFLERPALDVTLEERSDATNTLDLSIAVLPFSVVGTGAGATTYAEALTEELRTAVASHQELRLVSVPDAIAPQDVDQASYVVGGNMQRLEGRVRLRANLTRTDDRHTVWAKTFEHPAADEMPDPAETAVTVGRFVRLQVVQDQQCESVRRTSHSAEAANAYCAALTEFYRFGQTGDADVQLIRSHAQRAVDLDGEIVDAYYFLGYALLASGGPLNRREAIVKASAVLEQGMALAPKDPMVLALKGYIGLAKLDYADAEVSFNASLAVAPNHPLADVWYVYLGMLSLAQGHLSEALEQFRRALRINDANAIARAYYAGALLIAGENRKTIQVADEALKLVETGRPRVSLMGIKVVAQDALGEIAQANATLDEALTSVDPQWRALLAPQLALLGREQEARSILAKLDRLGDPPALLMANTYAVLNDGRTFDWMHKGIERHNISLIAGLRLPTLSPRPLAQDPRWNEVMKHLEAEEAAARMDSS